MRSPADRAAPRRFAEAFGTSVRWMRALRQRAQRGAQVAAPGRPRAPREEVERIERLVAEERARQGTSAGWRPILKALEDREPQISTTQVQRALARLKQTERRGRQRAIESERESRDVLARDALWGEDSTFLGRAGDGRAVSGEVVVDRATLATVGLAVGGSAGEKDVLALLERCAAERGGWPLVWQTDNGPANVGARLAARLEAEQVIHLRSRPHTPTDNAATERHIGELKQECGLGSGEEILTLQQAGMRLAAARRLLDQGRRRATRGWLTARELDARLPRAEALVDRRAFYVAARSASERAVLGLLDPIERRRAERDALWSELERFGLVRCSRGPRPRVRPAPTPCNAATPRVECRGERP